MRTTFRIFAAAASAALGILTSCQQGLEPFSDSKKLVPVTLKASFVQTKVSYAETTAKNLKPSWEADDKVIGFDGNNNTYEFTVTDVNATSGAATLTGTAPANCTLHLVYLGSATPASIEETSLPYEFSYADQAGDNTLPAVMFADGKVTFGTGDFHFSNAGAVIGIDAVKGVPNGSAISKVTVFGDNLAAATIALNGNNLALTATEAEGQSISTGTLTGVTVTDEVGTLNNTVFVAVPAGAVVSKVSVDVENKTYSYELNAPETLIANQYTYVSGKKFDREGIIKVSFSTIKTILEDSQPEFVGGEVIKISDGSATEDCTTAVEGGIAFIEPTLTGALTAVYPASAWTDAEPEFKVPTEQDGSLEGASIWKAEIADGAKSAKFETQATLFKVTPPSGVKQFSITSLKPVVDGVARTGTAVAINTEGGNEAAKLVITVGGASSELTKFYVSLVPGVNLTDLKFEYVTTGVAGMDGAIKGITDKSLTASSVSNATAANTLYTIDANNWHPYVEIAGKKWATMNVGATTVAGSYETCYGDYFAWGATEPYYTSISFTSASEATINGWKSGKENGYDWSTAPFNNGQPNYDSGYFLANKSTWLTDADVLKPAYDAATANWGSSWRMPTHEEFQALYSACTDKFEHAEPAPLPEPIEAGGVYWSADYNGVAGILFVDKSDISKRVFFPAAGYVDGTSFNNDGASGHYRSSSLYTDNPDFAYLLYFDDWAVNPSGSGGRYYGFTVRPFSE